MKKHSLVGYMEKEADISKYLKWTTYRDAWLETGIFKYKSYISRKPKERKKVKITIEEIKED